MPETKRMAEEAARMAQEAQEQAKTVGQEYQSAVESGFEAASAFADSQAPARGIWDHKTSMARWCRLAQID